MDTAPMVLEQPQKPPLPRPESITTLPVKWQVNAQGQFCLDAKNYENLSRNAAETARWVNEASWRLDYYATGKETKDVTKQ